MMGPWVLRNFDCDTLNGLAAGLADDEQRMAVEELVEAVMQHGEIRVWPEY